MVHIKMVSLGHIHPKLQKFFDKNDEVISVMFSVLKKIKPNIVDAYSYSTKNKPPNIRYKYTDKLYLGCILYIVQYNIGWESFLGPIYNFPGPQVGKRHREYLSKKVYSKFFKENITKRSFVIFIFSKNR